jgi:site-specific DNA-cytosine methylase
MFKAVDTLGFAGGFTMGMVQAGFELVGKRELPGGFGVANCEANRHLLGDNWWTESVDPAQWSVVDADVVFGNPPCSGFSGMSAKHFRGANSPINKCMWSFVDYVARVRPQVAVFESVQLAFTRADGLELMRALRTHLEEKTNEQWHLTHVLHNAYSLGGSSQRRRYFWVVSQVPFGVAWPRLERLPVLSDVIGDLETLDESWASQALVVDPSWWAQSRRNAAAAVDGHMAVRTPLTQRVVDLMEKVPWNSGEHLALVARRYHVQEKRLPNSWAFTADKTVASDFKLGFNTPVRWHWDQAARVITGGGLVTAMHPHLRRMFTHREVARIMGFPDDWLIEPLKNFPGLSATWGKGITVDCGRWIGGWIQQALAGSPGEYTGVSIGDRENLVDVTDAWKQSLVQSNSTLKKFRKLLSPTNGDKKIMTDPNVPEVPVTEGDAAAPQEATTKAGGKGRPRPQATIDQDARALEAITAKTNEGGSYTKDTLAADLGIPSSKAYLSLYRLRVENKIYKVRENGSYGWKAGEAPAATPSEAPAEAPVSF